MKHINSLIHDVYQRVETKDGWFTEELASILGSNIATTLRSQLGDVRPAPRLRLSQMGPKCPRSLWYSLHSPEMAEPLPGQAEIKYSYGHIIEALILTLIKGSGHSVEGVGDAIILDGVTGHRDCVVDGATVDIKSVSSMQFPKYRDKTLGKDDMFGYLDQLDGYVVGSLHDPLVTVKDRGYILAIDKTLGKMALYEHVVREDSIRSRIAAYKRIAESDTPPPCNCGVVADGAAGNLVLDTRAGYNNFKYACFPHLRTFLYSGGPRYFVKVVKQPMYRGEPLLEVDRAGNQVYR
jgi:hypothetical protein